MDGVYGWKFEELETIQEEKDDNNKDDNNKHNIVIDKLKKQLESAYLKQEEVSLELNLRIKTDRMDQNTGEIITKR